MGDIDIAELRAELARRDMKDWHLARDLNISPAALSAYKTGRVKPPPSLRLRIERALGLVEGQLKKKSGAG